MLISILSLVGYAGSTDYFVLCAVDFPFELEALWCGVKVKICFLKLAVFLSRSRFSACFLILNAF